MNEKNFEHESLPFDLENVIGTAFLNVVSAMNEEEIDQFANLLEKTTDRIKSEVDDLKKEKEEMKEEKDKKDDNPCRAFFDFIESLAVEEDEEEPEDEEDEVADLDDDEDEELTLEVDKINYTRNNMVVTWLDGTKTHVTNLFDGAYSPWNAFCSAVVERVYDSKERAMEQLEYGLDRGDK